jgi:hypothetical protein
LDFEVASYLQIIYSSFVKNLSQMGTQRSSASVIFWIKFFTKEEYIICR